MKPNVDQFVAIFGLVLFVATAGLGFSEGTIVFWGMFTMIFQLFSITNLQSQILVLLEK